MISTITGTITTLATPGAGNYAASLTISQNGAVEDSPTAIAASGFNDNVSNFGKIGGEVFLYLDSTLTNFGDISSSTTAALGETSDTVVNNSTITGGQVGIEFYSAGDVINTGLVQGGNIGLYALSGGYVLNSGTIQQANFTSGFQQIGMYLNGATLNNKGTISGLYGLQIQNSSVVNSGTIEGQSAAVIAIGNSGVFLNTGEITSSREAMYASGGIINNAGTINALVYGIKAKGQEQIFNSGSLYSSNRAISLRDGGAVTNSGIIDGGHNAILNTNTSLGLTLTVDAGAKFIGLVQDDSGQGELNLANTGAGSLDIAGSFSGFSHISFVASTTWTLEGTAQQLTSGQTINGFGQHDTIVLDGFSATSGTFVNGIGFIISNGVTSETLDLTGSFSAYIPTVTNIAGNSVIDLVPAPCFCAGTRIATARGNVPVEKLQAGDLVKTATHGFQPILWIGRRSYDGRMITGNHLALPVKIRRHAFARNVPSRDLYISPDHSLCEGGVLVHAWRFINGVSITQAQSVKAVEYYNIELESHAVIFAENTPVESYLDTGCRNRFQNAHTAPARTAAQAPCLPRVEDGYYLATLQARINARAGIAPLQTNNGPLRGNIDTADTVLSGWAQDETAPEVSVELELLCNGQVLTRFLANRYRADLRHAGLGSGCHAFQLTLPPLQGVLTIRRVADGAPLGGAGGGRHQPQQKTAA